MNTKPVILIVDDEPQILKIYGDTFKDEGFEVITASSGQECLKLAQEKIPNLILLDVKMPDMDGVQVFTKLKEDPRTKDLKVVFVFAFGDPRSVEIDADVAKKIGAIDFLKKGLSLDELVKKVKIYLGVLCLMPIFNLSPIINLLTKIS